MLYLTLVKHTCLFLLKDCIGFAVFNTVNTVYVCIFRSLEKGSPESPLNRAGKMLQAALDSKSPTTPRIRPRNKRSSQLSPEISSSPESPYGKRYCQSPSEG